MKMLRSFVFAFAVGVASAPVAQAHDSFSIGVNIGGHSHHAYPVVSHYVAPQPVHYYAPVVYHYQAPRVYYNAPIRSYSRHEGYRHHHESYGYRHGRHSRHD